MANLNKVFLMGNLTADPELRYTPKGTAVTDIRLAINRYYAGDNSERQEETTFVDVTRRKLPATTSARAAESLWKDAFNWIPGKIKPPGRNAPSCA